MSYLRIRKWDEWQTYRTDRDPPPWIKVYRRLLSDPDFVALTSLERGQLMCIWILAADREGKVPADPALLRKLCMLDEDVRIQVLIDRGFIEPDANVTPERRQHGALEAEAEAEKKKNTVHRFPAKPKKGSDGNLEYPEPFERAWSAYPRRAGSNPKVGAYDAFRKRVAEGAVPEQLVIAAAHYGVECKATKEEGTKYVLQAATFYGPKEPWREYVQPPEVNGSSPPEVDELERMRQLEEQTLASREASRGA